MRDDYTHITIVLDGSGSMASIADDTIGGLNSFIRDQKAVKGKATFTLVQFSDPDNIKYIYDGINIRNVANLTRHSYNPQGNTALLKAIEQTVDNTGEFLADMPESQRPSKVIFVIVTDGQENMSGYDANGHRYTKERISSRITRQRDTYKWEFVFLGANQDAISEGQSYGISMRNAMNYGATALGAAVLCSTLSKKVTRSRGAGGSAAGTMAFTDAEISANAPENTSGTATISADI